MSNPFEQRATEQLRDDEAFLSVVSPEPIRTWFEQPAKNGKLLNRLVMIIGTPGSGKTTMARIFEYPTLRLLLRNSELDIYRPLLAVLNEIGAVQDGEPSVLGARLPLESEYREFWEFPYTDELKIGLMMSMIQARAVLEWIRHLRTAGHDLDSVRFVPRESSKAALAAIGGPTTAGILQRAIEVERGIYDVSAALIPPSQDKIPAAASDAYRPFDVIDAVEVDNNGSVLRLQPLVILDDAHSLQADQFGLLRHSLTRRELRVARWVITRHDALTAEQVLLGRPGIIKERDDTVIQIQGSDRATERTAFRKMSRDMSSRYLKRMESFSRRGLDQLTTMLESEPERLSPSKMDELRRRVDSTQRRLHISDERRVELAGEAFDARQRTPEDVRLATVEILMRRYAGRVQHQQVSLFEDDPSPSRPIRADASVRDGAEIRLLHDHGRPYYFGMDSLSDAATENAEQFLQLAGAIVDRLEVKLARGRQPRLDAREQDRTLRAKATELVEAWNFPYARNVTRLTNEIAALCVARSLEPSAPLGGGAGGVGIPASEWERIVHSHPALTPVLQFAISYNAINLFRTSSKGQKWTVLELRGTLRLMHGLTLSRGGWIPSSLDALEEYAGVGRVA